jgi:hypothetical protein
MRRVIWPNYAGIDATSLAIGAVAIGPVSSGEKLIERGRNHGTCFDISVAASR